jgi:hypothetical protein
MSAIVFEISKLVDTFLSVIKVSSKILTSWINSSGFEKSSSSLDFQTVDLEGTVK